MSKKQALAELDRAALEASNIWSATEKEVKEAETWRAHAAIGLAEEAIGDERITDFALRTYRAASSQLAKAEAKEDEARKVWEAASDAYFEALDSAQEKPPAVAPAEGIETSSERLEKSDFNV